jgi:hypothetical protein
VVVDRVRDAGLTCNYVDTSKVTMIRQPSIGLLLVGEDVRLCFVFWIVFYKIKTVGCCFLRIAVDTRI